MDEGTGSSPSFRVSGAMRNISIIGYRIVEYGGEREYIKLHPISTMKEVVAGAVTETATETTRIIEKEWGDFPVKRSL